MAEFMHDPLGFVMAAFDWGHGELADLEGPDEWQVGVLDEIGERLRKGEIEASEAIQIAIASGHGIGKSALVAWIILWAISTYEDTKGVVTANTENQLKTKTWAELAKWHRLCVTNLWFKFEATALFSRSAAHSKTWRVDMVSWSKDNTEAFAGLHNQGKRILLIFDEASAIDDKIWEVSEGALTDDDTEIIWCCFGNPTKNTGRFRECFSKFRHRWFTKQIDSRTVKITNKAQIAKWVEDHGEDSDFVRVRVRGVFPSASANALIGPEEVDVAMKRYYDETTYNFQARILGVDVARQGDDSSVICKRQGLVSSSFRSLKIPDIMQLAAQVALDINSWQADAIFVDGTGGYGAGVVDALRNTRYNPIEVQFAGKATNNRYFNKRSEIWFEMINWIKEGGAIPDDPELKEELCAATYTFQGDKFRLCSKDDIKEIIGRSPDKADALALTFAYPVAPISKTIIPNRSDNRKSKEYNPYERV